MSRETKELRRHLKDPYLKSWLKTNDAWFQAHPSALRSLLDNPEMISVMQKRLEERKTKLTRRSSRRANAATITTLVPYYSDNRSNSRANTCVNPDSWKGRIY